jgi:hypothetical protein
LQNPSLYLAATSATPHLVPSSSHNEYSAYRGGQNNGNTKKLKIKFVLSTLKELGTMNDVLPHLFTLCSAHVSALVIVLSNSPGERIAKCDICPILKEDGELVHVY